MEMEMQYDSEMENQDDVVVLPNSMDDFGSDDELEDNEQGEEVLEEAAESVKKGKEKVIRTPSKGKRCGKNGAAKSNNEEMEDRIYKSLDKMQGYINRKLADMN